MCVFERERERGMYVLERERVCVRERGEVGMYVLERESVCVCVCVC